MKKPFIFKGYKTETVRIKETIKNNKYLYKLNLIFKFSFQIKEDLFNKEIAKEDIVKLPKK